MTIRFLVAAGLLISSPLGLSACGSSSTSQSSPPAQSNPSPSPSPSGPVVLGTSNAAVAGASETILIDVRGMTLYYRTSDTATVVCSGGCATVWPPLLLASGTPASSTSVSGTLSVLADANGNQVTYNGHPLYTYSKDSAKGDTNGEGVGGVWHVATPSLAAA
jgi:predicted lipoprotein with Yx(FWY)xxD motif